jgi:hypothetical protein
VFLRAFFTAADPLPDDLRTALEAIHRPDKPAH